MRVTIVFEYLKIIVIHSASEAQHNSGFIVVRSFCFKLIPNQNWVTHNLVSTDILGFGLQTVNIITKCHVSLDKTGMMSKVIPITNITLLFYVF